MKTNEIISLKDEAMKEFRYNRSEEKKQDIFRVLAEVFGENPSLHVAGDFSINSSAPRILIVGTRDIDSYGKSMIRRIVSALTALPKRPVILTKGAFGVCQEAIHAALEENLPLAVMLGSGLDKPYPFAMNNLLETVATTKGDAVMTFKQNGSVPTAVEMLVSTNYLAAIADIVIVPSSKRHGSAMVAARMAADNGIPVFAVPGRVDDSRAGGTNQLIAEGLAEPIWDMVEFRKKVEYYCELIK